LTNCCQLALPKNREATYPLAEFVNGKLALGPSYQLLGLAGGGVCPVGAVTGSAVRSYRTISPLPVSIPILAFVIKHGGGAIGCVFSVALSLGLPPVAVSHHR
jgi:hypothetical protein